MHTVTLNWTQTTAAGRLDGAISSPDDEPAPTRHGATCTFGAERQWRAGRHDRRASQTRPARLASPHRYAAGDPAPSFRFTADFGSGPQTITLNLGTYGQTDGVTQYAGTHLQPARPDPERCAAGRILLGHHPGQRQHRGQLRQRPVAHDRAGSDDHLQRTRRVAAPERPGFHRDLGLRHAARRSRRHQWRRHPCHQSIESSNVDIATEFSKLIVAQQAYSANTKMVTTADQMLQQTINMKQ